MLGATAHTGSPAVIKLCIVPFTPWPLQLWPDANQSASKVGVADKAEGIREIKLLWHAVIYITIDLPLQQINHLCPSTAFLIFPAIPDTPVRAAVVGRRRDGWDDMLVIVLTPDVGSLWSNVVRGFRQKGAVLPLLAAHQSGD